SVSGSPSGGSPDRARRALRSTRDSCIGDVRALLGRIARHRERAHAAAARGVALHVEACAPGARLRAVQNGLQILSLVQVAERRLKETGPHGSVGLDDGRHPRSIAAIKGELTLAQ